MKSTYYIKSKKFASVRYYKQEGDHLCTEAESALDFLALFGLLEDATGRLKFLIVVTFVLDVR